VANVHIVTLSPDGRFLAATSRVNDRMNIAVIERAAQKAQALTNLSDIEAKVRDLQNLPTTS
jgi:6-phosphogluconolactonase (cycloisomerase 2 family)